jgi:glycosyltransferase involved in cell wall biosynthesis
VAPTVDERAEARRQLGVDDNQFVILFAGDLRTPRKNFDVLLRALKSLPKHVVLLAAGNHEEGPYPSLTKDAGLSARVRFLGTRRDMAAVYPAGDVFALLSHYDPFGLVVTEAMSAGLPVLTASTVGASAVVAIHEAGYVIADPTDDAAVARAVTDLLGDACRRGEMGSRGRCVANELSWSRIGERYAQVIAETFAHAS